LFLNLDVKDKKNKILRETTKEFICENFTIECIEINLDENLLETEHKYILKYKPCLNVKNK
jgi:hypothetical protein